MVERIVNTMNERFRFPTTTYGKSSVILGMTVILLFLFKFLNLRLPIPSPILALLSLIAFVLAIISIIKEKTKSLLIYIPLLFGFLVLVWVVLEIAFPH